MKIEKTIHQVWIGPAEPPFKWMSSWKKYNPDWDYVYWDNKAILSKKWKNQHIIDIYLKDYFDNVKGKSIKGTDQFTLASGKTIIGERATFFAWHVIADVVRYEILHEYGGFMPGADTECLKPITGLIKPETELYLINTGYLHADGLSRLLARFNNNVDAIKKAGGKDWLTYNRLLPENAAPIAACTKGNPFAKLAIDELHKLKKEDLGEAVDTTGNVFMGRLLRMTTPDNLQTDLYKTKKQRILDGDPTIHHSGTTRGTYNKGRFKRSSRQIS